MWTAGLGGPYVWHDKVMASVVEFHASFTWLILDQVGCFCCFLEVPTWLLQEV